MSHKVEVSADTRKQMADELRRSLRHYDSNPLATWRWWSGFIWGVVFMAFCDFTDVHFCIGECDGAGGELLP